MPLKPPSKYAVSKPSNLITKTLHKEPSISDLDSPTSLNEVFLTQFMSDFNATSSNHSTAMLTSKNDEHLSPKDLNHPDITCPLLLRSTSGGQEYVEGQTLLIEEFDQLSKRYLFSEESRDLIKQIVSCYNSGSRCETPKSKEVSDEPKKETLTFIQALDTLVLSSAFNNRATSPSCFHKIPYIRLLALYIEKKRLYGIELEVEVL